MVKGKQIRRNFQATANSCQTMYIEWILAAKRPQIRSRRIAEVVIRAEQDIRPGIQSSGQAQDMLFRFFETLYNTDKSERNG